jgi:hypothetical protein
MDTVLLDLTPEDHANPPQDSRDQVILAETVEHVVAGPLTTTDDLDSFMEASSLEEMEADESLEEIGAEEVRLLADEEVVEGLGEEEMLDDDDLAELQSLDEEMAALEEQEVEALSGLEALEDEDDEVVPATFVETPDEDLATWKQAKERVREYAVETFQEVLDEEPPAAKESTDEAWEAAEEAAEVLEETAHQIADEISQEEQTFANWEQAEDEFMQHERYTESPELPPAWLVSRWKKPCKATCLAGHWKPLWSPWCSAQLHRRSTRRFQKLSSRSSKVSGISRTDSHHSFQADPLSAAGGPAPASVPILTTSVVSHLPPDCKAVRSV